jgi:hypothetical protein
MLSYLVLIHVIILNIKNVKLVKFHVISGVVSYKSFSCFTYFHTNNIFIAKFSASHVPDLNFIIVTWYIMFVADLMWKWGKTTEISLQMSVKRRWSTANECQEAMKYCKWVSRGDGVLQMSVKRRWSTANECQEAMMYYKWVSRDDEVLQMSVKRRWSTANECQETMKYCKWVSRGGKVLQMSVKRRWSTANECQEVAKYCKWVSRGDEVLQMSVQRRWSTANDCQEAMKYCKWVSRGDKVSFCKREFGQKKLRMTITSGNNHPSYSSQEQGLWVLNRPFEMWRRTFWETRKCGCHSFPYPERSNNIC